MNSPWNRLGKLAQGSIYAWRPYTWVTLGIVLLTLMLHSFETFFDNVNIALIYLFPILISAVYGGVGPSIFAACLSVLVFDFYFIPPFLSFTIADLRYLLSFVVYLAVAILTASLAARLKQQLYVAKRREATTATLYALSRQMTAITDLQSLLDNVSRQVSETVGAQAVIYMPDAEDELKVMTSSADPAYWGDGPSEMGIAKWVYMHGEMAGRGSGTLRESSGLYVPLRTEERVYGVLAVNLDLYEQPVAGADAPDQVRLLEAIGGLAASAVARVKLGEEAKLAHLMAESERIRTALLDSVSHELRTPLATIIGSATGLIEGDVMFSREDRLDLLATIRDGALRMNRLVTNLLGMVKLESGMLTLRKTWCDPADIIGVVLAQVKDFQQHRKIIVELPDTVPYLYGDEVLLEQVIVNVISNAIKYSPDYSEIVVTAARAEDGQHLILTVADTGTGIAAADRERIFDKFYRSPATSYVTGTGLGLAICKGIIEAHGGTITAEANLERGTVIRIVLPSGDERLLQDWISERTND